MRKILLFGLIAATAAPAVHATETVTYTYDALGRLASAAHAGSVNSGVQTTYTLDPADNRKAVTTTGASQ